MTLVATGRREFVRILMGRYKACKRHRILGSRNCAPIKRRTHPEKKWAAGTNKSKAKAQSLMGESRLPRWVDATLGGAASHRGMQIDLILSIN